LGFVMWPTMARLVRGQALVIREATYIEAAVAAGGTSAWIIRRHVWPNIMRIVAAQFAIAVSLATITAASLSFLGLGIPPPDPVWGVWFGSAFKSLPPTPAMGLAPAVATTITILGFYPGGSGAE